MLKLSKYEIRKNIGALILLLGGLGVLQIWFMVSVYAKKEGSIVGSIIVLFLYALVCFFAVFIFAVTNYYREINSKTSYLVFMTPISPLRIILSKMLTVLIIGVLLGGILILLGIADINMVADSVEEFRDIQEALNDVFRQFGFFTGKIIFNIVFNVVSFLLAFYAHVAMVYFCITLTATLLQSSRFRALVSILFFLVLSWARGFIQGFITDKVPLRDTMVEVTASEIMTQMTPYTILNLVTVVIMIAATTWLLKYRLSL